METIFDTLISLGSLIIGIAFIIAITPYLFMLFMYNQMKMLQQKLDTIISTLTHENKADTQSSYEPKESFDEYPSAKIVAKEVKETKQQSNHLSTKEIVFFSSLIALMIIAIIIIILCI